MAAFLYTLISIILFPVSLLGYVIWAGALMAGRGSGVSGTAQGPLSARFFMHQLGLRQDEPANRLMWSLPNTPTLGVQLFLWPLKTGHRLTGYVPRAFRYPYEGEVVPQHAASARMTFIDRVIKRELGAIQQFVILGAGFDTRPYRLPKDTPVRSFEVDMPKTQAMKQDVLKRAGIDTAGVTFVPADFEKDDWLKRLVESGFDTARPALFLWEGVMMYLDRAAVEETLRKIAGTAKGSLVVFDYITTEPLEGDAFYWRYVRAAIKAAGEPFKFGIDSTPPTRERLRELLQSCGLELVEQRTYGQETGDKRSFGGFAVARVA